VVGIHPYEFQDEGRRSVVPPDLLLMGLYQAPTGITIRHAAAPTEQNHLPFSLDLEGFFARWLMRDSHRRPLSGMPPREWARASFPPGYSSSATLLI